MKFVATLAACCVAAALIGCETTEETPTNVAPGAVAGEHENCGTDACCGTCPEGKKADEVAPGAVSEDACGSSCGSAKSCGAAAPISMGAVEDAACGSAKDCGSAKKSCSDAEAPVAMGAVTEKAGGCCPGH